MTETSKTHYLACDLGAESGRLMLGTLEHGKLSLEILRRFPNLPVREGESLHWDVPNLIHEFASGLREAASGAARPISSISTDSWGLDYLLIQPDGSFLLPAFHYRDPRTRRGVERTLAAVRRDEIFAATGIQFMPINTLFQLAAEDPERLRAAKTLVSIADGFNYWLCGHAVVEESMASTFQLYDPRARSWSSHLAGSIGLPEGLLPKVVPSGTLLGPVKPGIATECGLEGTEVIASCSHDTGAAVAAIPASGQDWAYISSGTWSLMGVEISQPILNVRCQELNFTNEIGFGGSIRLLKNIVGLWILQECRREWERQGQPLEYGELMRLAGDAPAFHCLIDGADPRFASPGSMPEKIASYCRESGQPEPGTPGAVVRCILESLALMYRETLQHLEELTCEKLARIHVVGGGSQNALLCQFTADALERPVFAGPVEATTIGNVLVQALALGHLPSLAAGREMVCASFSLRQYTPAGLPNWRAAAGRLCQIRSRMGSNQL